MDSASVSAVSRTVAESRRGHDRGIPKRANFSTLSGLRVEDGPRDPPQGVSFFRQGDEPLSRFRFVSAHRDQYPVTALCRVARVSRSGYYAWAGRDPSPRCVDDAYLADTIREIYRRSRCTYGAPRVHGQLCRIGTRVGRKRVARLMAELDLVGVHSRKKWRRGRLDVAPAPDLLQRDFSASRPNQRWVADITEFMTGEGKLFLARMCRFSGTRSRRTGAVTYASSRLLVRLGWSAAEPLGL